MRSWRYYRDLLAYYLTLLLLLLAAARALRQPVYWLAAALLWMLHQAVRRAFGFAHPPRRLSPLMEGLEDLKEVRFEGRDGLSLSGRFASSRNQGTILLAHGLGASGQDLTVLARLLMRAGFGILLLDLRAHGNSQGDTSTYGLKEGGDVVCAVEYLKRRIDVHGGKIGAYGLSLGAQAVLRGALLTEDLRALALEDLGPVRLSDHGGRPRSLLRWLNLPFNWLYYRVYDWMAGGRQPGVLEVIGGLSPRPLYLISGGAQDSYFNRLFFQAAREPKEHWEVAEAHHAGALAAQPEEYMQRLTGFFIKSLDIQTGAEWQQKIPTRSTN